MWVVYILKCENGSLYTGITNDLERRFKEHQLGKGGHYTGANRPTKIVYTEKHKTKSKALKREAEIKKWKRDKKLTLFIKKIGG
ncbi:MAG: GIY-YIG nuclease family protein [Candidatus Paceibacterota bacterium]|jgi:putative endonuclease